MTLYLAIYEHKHGADHAIFSTRENAQKWKDELGKTYWSDVSDEDAPAEDIGDKYFDLAGEMCNEWFNVEEHGIDPDLRG